MDLVVVANSFPKKGETTMGNDFFTNPGGKGANQAVALAKMGADVEMVGAVGQEFGDELLKTLKKYNVSTTYVKNHKNVSSGIATIIVADGDNRIIVNAGSNALISKEDVDKALHKASAGDFMLCQLEIPLPIVEYALVQAKAKGMVTFLNPAPYASLTAAIFTNADYFLPNQSETLLYTDIYPSNVEEARKAAQKITELGIKNVLITLGENGAYFYNKEKEYYVPAYETKALDTTGAGDTYVGTFLSMLAEQKEISDAMDCASLASSITVQRLGAQQAIPYRAELEKLRRQHANS
jgi:ribokinase